MTLKGVYLLHFDREVDYPKYSLYGDKRHYIGKSTDIRHRVRQHERGEGSKMTQAAVSQGVEITVAAVFNVGVGDAEQVLTRVGADKFCPICLVENAPPKPKPKSTTGFFSLKRPGMCAQCFAHIKPGATVEKYGTAYRCFKHHVIESRRNT